MIEENGYRLASVIGMEVTLNRHSQNLRFCRQAAGSFPSS